MEPRPQRPRSTAGRGQHPGAAQTGRSAPPPSGYQQESAEAYVDDYEEQTFIAPPRTEYDYSPLDLAPPGQRRRRQFVAAAIGALALLMVAAIAVLGYLIFDDDDEDPSLDVAALATENAATRSALDAESTTIADAGAAQTATAGGEAVSTEEATEESEETESTSTTEGEGEANPTEANADGTEAPTEEASGSEPTEEPVDDGETEDSTSGDATVEELEALQPGVDVLPTGFDTEEDISLEEADVVTALGGSRTAEQNLEQWGWFGNSGRAWSPSDPSVLEEGATTSMNSSIHGFKDAASAAEALTFFTDILATSGYEEGEAPDLGESSRILTSEGEDGVIVALYVQQDGVMYRFGGFAPPGGDPTQDVINLATETVPAGE